MTDHSEDGDATVDAVVDLIDEKTPVVRYTGTADVRELTGPDGWPLAWSAENDMAVPLEEFKAALGDGWEQFLADNSTEFVAFPPIEGLSDHASVEFQIGE